MKKLAFLCVMFFGSAAVADSIDVKLASFELDPPQAAGDWTNEYPDWSGPAVAGDSFVEYIDGFSSDGNSHIGLQNASEVSQDLGIAAAANTTYELTVGVGNRNASFSPTDGTQASTFGLYAGGDAEDGGSLLGDLTVDAGPLGESTFADYTATITTGDSVSGNLFVSLRNTGAGRSHFDNVRLSVVPEPSSIALFLLGGLGLLAQRRR